MRFLIFISCAFLVVQVKNESRIQIFHNNNLNSRFEEISRKYLIQCTNRDACYGGFARILHVLKTARNASLYGNEPPTLYFNTGDTFGGSLWFNVHKTSIVTEFMNLLKPDAICLGNKEFTHGVKKLMPFIKEFNSPIIVTNLNYSNEPDWSVPIKTSHVVTVGELQVGYLGFLAARFKSVANMANVILHSEITSIETEVHRLTDLGVKVIIVLAHSNLEESEAVALIPNIDLVIGCQETFTEFLYSGKPPDIEKPSHSYPIVVTQLNGRRVPIVSAFSYGKYLGKITLIFDDDGYLHNWHGTQILLNNKIKQDQEALNLLEKYRPKVNEALETVVAVSKVQLQSKQCSQIECHLGNVVADALVYKNMMDFKGETWTDAPIAFLNGGTIKSSIDKGVVVLAEILNLLPFQNDIFTAKINGKVLKAIFAQAFKQNKLLQVSGIKIVYNKKESDPVVSMELRCYKCEVPSYEPLKLTKNYYVITNEYLLQGGDSYEILRRTVKKKKLVGVDSDIVNWYLKTKKIIAIETFNRIVIQSKAWRFEGNFLIKGIIFKILFY